MVLNYDSKDPLILSCVLTNISALFPFVVHRPHFLTQILYKVGKVDVIYFFGSVNCVLNVGESGLTFCSPSTAVQSHHI